MHRPSTFVPSRKMKLGHLFPECIALILLRMRMMMSDVASWLSSGAVS